VRGSPEHDRHEIRFHALAIHDSNLILRDFIDFHLTLSQLFPAQMIESVRPRREEHDFARTFTRAGGACSLSGPTN